MKKYIFKRVLYSIVAILVLLLLLFTMLQYMPGSPFNDDKLSQEQIDKLIGLRTQIIEETTRSMFDI